MASTATARCVIRRRILILYRLRFFTRFRGRRSSRGRCAHNRGVVRLVQRERERLIAFCSDDADCRIIYKAFTDQNSAIVCIYIVLCIVIDERRIVDLFPRGSINLHIGDCAQPLCRIGKGHVKVIAEGCRYRKIGWCILILFRLRWGGCSVQPPGSLRLRCRHRYS